jgi:hypothetical protein
MEIYVNLAKRLRFDSTPLGPWDVTHPLGYPLLLSWLMTEAGSLTRAVWLQVVVSSLTPLAVGLLARFAYGWRTALAAVAVASVYFPFIEFGALFLSEVHFIFCLSLAFAGFLAARAAERRSVSIALAAAGGFALSIAAALKSVALPAAIAFFAMEALALLLARAPAGPSWRVRLAPWLLRTSVAVVAAVPILGLLARVCTSGNRGAFCVTGNKVGADFLLGHYGQIADISWAADQGHGFGFGSPGSYLRHYVEHPRVPFTMTDNAANRAEAWRWILAHPFDAFVLSIDHIYDTFFGFAMWPTYGLKFWQYAHLFQYVFVALLFVPTVIVCVRLTKRSVRTLLTSRTMLMLSPLLALTAIVAYATGEVRYRIPFDIFFIAIVCAFATGEQKRVDAQGAG